MRLDDFLYGETDDACAMCGTRGRGNLSVHHIDGDPSRNEYGNMVVICHNCHHRHNHEQPPTRREIEDRKRHLIAKTLTQYGMNALKIAARNGYGVVAMPFLLYHLLDLGLMSKEEAQMGYGEQEDATARFAITAGGRDFVQRWLKT
jgi:hypothetical protein